MPLYKLTEKRLKKRQREDEAGITELKAKMRAMGDEVGDSEDEMDSESDDSEEESEDDEEETGEETAGETSGSDYEEEEAEEEEKNGSDEDEDENGRKSQFHFPSRSHRFTPPYSDPHDTLRSAHNPHLHSHLHPY